MRHKIEELEKTIIKKEKNISLQIINSANNIDPHTLPNIYTYSYNNVKYVRKSDSSPGIKPLFNSSTLPDPIKLQKKEFKKAVLACRMKDPTNEEMAQKRIKHLSKRETNKLIQKYGIDDDDKVKSKFKRPVGCVNFMDKSKLLKYSNLGRINNHQGLTFDDNQRPLITKDEMEKGMLNMIYRGLIPRNADLTSMFSHEGHPISITNNVKEIYTRTKLKEEVQTGLPQRETSLFITAKGEVNNNSESLYDTNSHAEEDAYESIRTENVDPNDKEKEENGDDVEDVNQSQSNQLGNDQSSTHVVNVSNLTSLSHKQTMRSHSKDKSNIHTKDTPTAKEIKKKIMFVKQNEQIAESFESEIDKPKNLDLIFLNYKVVQNEDFCEFRGRNSENWGVVSYLIDHLQKLFKKLNYNVVEVDSNKLQSLAKDELRTFTIKDFLGCISDSDLEKKGLNVLNLRHLSSNIREIFIIKIQCLIRVFLAKKRVAFMRFFLQKVNRIQRYFRIYKLLDDSRSLLVNEYNNNLAKFEVMMKEFRANWREIKNSRRIEIHINSLSYSTYKNCTIEKFLEKESNQLNRLIALQDPNVEIIYVSPFPLQNEVLSYYFSILATLGVENAKERFHIVVPDIIDYLPPNHSLAALLFYSSETLNKIRRFIKGKEKSTYIVPGVVSHFDLRVSMNLQCPILMDSPDVTFNLFTKSGAKRVFEINNMALPISAWDIKSEEDFYFSLTHLIKNYLSTNIWIFKIDSEHNGRGIAYVILDKIQKFVNLKKDRLNNILDDENKFEKQLKEILRKSVPKKAEVVSNKIYQGWSEFFAEFCRVGGIIESCPTGSLSSIIGSPAVSFLIEPDGHIESVCTYDKLNVNCFKNFAFTSPQNSIPTMNTHMIVEKLGNYLRDKGVIGYVTAEFITFYDNQNILFWGIDLKFGYSDQIAIIKLCDFLYNKSLKITDGQRQNNFIFSIPTIIHANIAKLKMKELVLSFRSELIVYDIEKQNGVLFNLPDTLQCGMIGLSAISNSIASLWKLVESSINLLKSQIQSEEYGKFAEDSRTDLIEFSDIISRLKTIGKNILHNNK